MELLHEIFGLLKKGIACSRICDILFFINHRIQEDNMPAKKSTSKPVATKKKAAAAKPVKAKKKLAPKSAAKSTAKKSTKPSFDIESLSPEQGDGRSGGDAHQKTSTVSK
jgi:hypothetical protein